MEQGVTRAAGGVRLMSQRDEPYLRGLLPTLAIGETVVWPAEGVPSLRAALTRSCHATKTAVSSRVSPTGDLVYVTRIR